MKPQVSGTTEEEDTLLALHIVEGIIDFTLPGVDGKQHSYADYHDQSILVLIFSCNHCPYVRAWEDRMIAIQQDYADKGVQLIAINANDASKYPDDSFEQMQQRATEKGFNFPYLHDETQQVAQAFAAQRTPEVFVFDQQRRLRFHGAIDDHFEDPEKVNNHYLRQTLDALLAGETPAIQETNPVGCTIKWK
ncbi:MAG: thioredoxin family protein [Chloroflexaceae bacterium]|nr:thioredoxin family protein [Chloroflexaceae bacterium]